MQYANISKISVADIWFFARCLLFEYYSHQNFCTYYSNTVTFSIYGATLHNGIWRYTHKASHSTQRFCKQMAIGTLPDVLQKGKPWSVFYEISGRTFPFEVGSMLSTEEVMNFFWRRAQQPKRGIEAQYRKHRIILFLRYFSC